MLAPSNRSSNEDTPANPVELVQQIRLLTLLDRKPFESDYRVNPPSNVLQNAIMALGPNTLNRRMVIVSAAEGAISIFSAVVAADRTGDLTRRLIEDSCMIEYLINTIKSSPETRNELVKSALSALGTLYVRSRLTCALVSRLLPPSFTTMLYQSKVADGAISLGACAYASYILYPGAHDLACPKQSTGLPRATPCAEAKEALVVRDTDINPVLVFPQHSSDFFLLEEVADGWGQSEEAHELPIEKEAFNMALVPYGTHNNPIGEAIAFADAQGFEVQPERKHASLCFDG